MENVENYAEICESWAVVEFSDYSWRPIKIVGKFPSEDEAKIVAREAMISKGNDKNYLHAVMPISYGIMKMYHL